MIPNAHRELEPESQEQPGCPVDGPAGRYRELLDIEDEIAASIAVAPCLAQDAVHDRLMAGVPLLSFDDFFPVWSQAQAALQRVIKWAAREGANPKDENEWAGVEINAPLFRELAIAWYSGGVPGSLAWSQTTAELIAVVGASLKPFLKVRSKLLAPMVEQALWRRPHCPVCGGRPDFGYLDREQGNRWLLCSRCDAEWLFQRLECPYCGMRDQTKLAYLTDDAGLYRLYVCDACRTYLKLIDMRNSKSNVRLPLERYLTIDLDRQAIVNSYLPGCKDPGQSDHSGEL